LHERTYSAGQEVVTEGENGLGFFAILAGTANVSVGGADGRPLHCAGMTAWNFRPFVGYHPEVAWSLLKTLAQRLRAAEARA
jgi:CRP-like cAMP-binding protein